MKSDIAGLIKQIKTFRFSSIFVRNMISIMLVIFIPFSLVGVFFSVMIHDNMEEEARAGASNALMTAKNTVDMILSTTETIAIHTSFNQNVESFLYSSYTSQEASRVYTNIRDYIKGFIYTHTYIHSIYVYSEKSNLIINNNEVSNIEMFSDTGWMDCYKALPISGNQIIARKYDDRYPSFISVVRSVGVDKGKKYGCVVVNIDVKSIMKLFEKNNDCDTMNFLVNSDNTVYLSGVSRMVGEKFNSLSQLMGLESRVDDEELKKNYVYTELMSEEYKNLKYISIMSSRALNDARSHTAIYIILIAMTLLIVEIIMALWISVRTYEPIKNILNFLTPNELNEVSSMDKNELSYIAASIKNSHIKNKELELELQYKLLMLNKTQLYALQTQVNPHFLNNALEAISWAAVEDMGITNRVSKMLKSLSRLFKVSLDVENIIIPIDEEMQHANIYLYIIGEYYGDNLNLIWDMEPGIGECKIIKLTLQPLLENAVEHGISHKSSGSNITITGRVVGDNILLSVHDDGVGMSREVLDELKESLGNSEMTGKHIGLKNINRRIKLVFGNEYGLSIDSTEGEGTTVNILIPKI